MEALISMKGKLWAIALLALALCACALSASAQEARDITNECVFTSPGRKTASVHDGAYTSYWNSDTRSRPYLEITTPEGVQAQYLYICFANMPEKWTVEQEVDGEWQPLYTGTTDYYHALVELGGKTHFRLRDDCGYRTTLKINEVYVFTEGDLPDWVQRWEPTCEKADLLLLVAHPDDELIWFGGTIATYAAERGLNVVVAYMTDSNTTRRSELLNGLWHMGLRNYPVIGPFYDGYSFKLADAYEKWPKTRARTFVMELLRKYKPEVVLTHDVGGEYGHGAHKLCADVMQYCVENASDASVLPDSAKEYGTWDVKKFYVHLGEESTTEMNWRVPLASMGGKTGLQLAQEAYTFHVTQQNTEYVVTDEGEYSNARFTLMRSLVGEDVRGGDFMENLPGLDPNIVLTPTPVPTPTPTPAPTRAPGEIVRADVEWPETPPMPLDAHGYPTEGEYVFADEEAGLWFYASPSLVVRVDRIFDEDAVLTWYEAHIFCDTDRERFGIVLYNEEEPRKKHVQAELIAKEKQVVFGMNTDYYSYRVGRKTITGMVIRGGEVFFDRVPEANRHQFPNLDTLALYGDGTWGVYHSDERTAEEYLADGAIDVLSFGPYLVRDGEANEFVDQMTNGKTEQPRCAVGMIEQGHYFALLAEGRIRNISVGVSVPWLQQKMLEAGCQQALNLDGGQTAVMTFMGKQITRIGKYNGGKTSPRTTTEILGIGRSDQINPTAE